MLFKIYIPVRRNKRKEKMGINITHAKKIQKGTVNFACLDQKQYTLFGGMNLAILQYMPLLRSVQRNLHGKKAVMLTRQPRKRRSSQKGPRLPMKLRLSPRRRLLLSMMISLLAKKLSLRKQKRMRLPKLPLRKRLTVKRRKIKSQRRKQ